MPSLQSLQSLLGVAAIIAIAFVISEDRRAVPWRQVLTGLALTFALALLRSIGEWSQIHQVSVRP